MPPVPSRRHQCSECNKTYSTNSHLRRHEKTHSSKHSWTCPFCQAQFSRSDVASRHVKGCSFDGRTVTFPTLRRGKRRTACDRCSQRKLSCDTKMPCTRCKSGYTDCIYPQPLVSSSSPAIPQDSQSSLLIAKDANVDSNCDGGRISIEFLLNFTRPTGYGASAAVAEDSADGQIEDETITHLALGPTSEEQYVATRTPFWGHDEDMFNFFDIPSPSSREEYCFNQDITTLETQETIALEARMSEVVHHLSATHNSTSRHDLNVGANFDAHLADAVFTVLNLRHFVWRFFHRFYYHMPILHRPTFDIETVSMPLLLSVFLLGSICSTPADIALSTRQFFDVAEEYIFDHPIMKQLLQGLHEPGCSKEEIEILQATLLIVIIQNNRQDVLTRRRLRLERIPTWVSAVRRSGLFEFRYDHLKDDSATSNWQCFISNEIRVRIAMWTFMTESTFAVFYNKTPEVAISELLGDFPCSEDIFEAETASEYERLALQERAKPPPYAPSEIISLVLNPCNLEPVGARITAAQMLFIVCALQSIAMTSKLSLLAPATAETILRATDRWKSLWDVISKRESQSLQRLGFVRHVTEFWWFTRTLVKVMQRGDCNCRYLQTVPTDSMADMHEFIRKYENGF